MLTIREPKCHAIEVHLWNTISEVGIKQVVVTVCRDGCQRKKDNAPGGRRDETIEAAS